MTKITSSWLCLKVSSRKRKALSKNRPVSSPNSLRRATSSPNHTRTASMAPPAGISSRRRFSRYCSSLFTRCMERSRSSFSSCPASCARFSFSCCCAISCCNTASGSASEIFALNAPNSPCSRVVSASCIRVAFALSVKRERIKPMTESFSSKGASRSSRTVMECQVPCRISSTW